MTAWQIDGRAEHLQTFHAQCCLLGMALWVTLMPAVTGEAVADQVAPPLAIVLDFELLDTSLEGEVKGENPDETQRLELISDLLRQLIADGGHFTVVDHAPAAEMIADAGYIHRCNGCESKIAQELGAEYVVSGLVQKV
ncbi:MAG: DUF3280 domain-containing protein, partial [bacterium]|nr:DUF3280 domain-containing protein [bacterium]